MVVSISVGDAFTSYAELLERIEKYCLTNYIHLWMREARTLAAGVKKAPKKIEAANPELKYYSIKYCCIHGGKKFRPKGKGIRDSSARTLKNDCPFSISFGLSDDGQQLEVKSMQNVHQNHEISEASMASEDEFVDHTEWTIERLQILVSLYANEESLWNTACPDNHHKEPRRAAFNRIAVEMNLPLESVLRKIRQLRTYYTSELNKTREATRKPYRPRWPLYRILDSFLREHIQHRQITGIAESKHEESGDTNFYEDNDDEYNCDSILQSEDIKLLMGQPTVVTTTDSFSELTTDSISKKRSSDFEELSPKKMKVCPSSPSDKDANESNSSALWTEDPDALFGRHIANELRLINDLKAKQFAKLQIHNILFNAQFGLTAVPDEFTIPTLLSESLDKCLYQTRQNENHST